MLTGSTLVSHTVDTEHRRRKKEPKLKTRGKEINRHGESPVALLLPVSDNERAVSARSSLFSASLWNCTASVGLLCSSRNLVSSHVFITSLSLKKRVFCNSANHCVSSYNVFYFGSGTKLMVKPSKLSLPTHCTKFLFSVYICFEFSSAWVLVQCFIGHSLSLSSEQI